MPQQVFAACLLHGWALEISTDFQELRRRRGEGLRGTGCRFPGDLSLDEKQDHRRVQDHKTDQQRLLYPDSGGDADSGA